MLRNSLTTGVANMTFTFGQPLTPPGTGWLPVTGDWSGSLAELAANGPSSSAAASCRPYTGRTPANRSRGDRPLGCGRGQFRGADGNDASQMRDQRFAWV